MKRAGQKIDLQPREFRLLEYLMRHAGQVVTRTMLLEGVWDYHFDPQTNVIDVHVSRLRQKVDKPFPTPLIHTVRNAGYMLRAEAAVTMADEPALLRSRAAGRCAPREPASAPSARRTARSAGLAPRGVCCARPASASALIYAVPARRSARSALALFLWWSTAGLLDRQTEAAIKADAQGLSERFADGGLPALVLTIEERLAQNVDDDAIYLLVDPAGRTASPATWTRWPQGVGARTATGTSCRSSAPAYARWRGCSATTCPAASTC